MNGHITHADDRAAFPVPLPDDETGTVVLSAPAASLKPADAPSIFWPAGHKDRAHEAAWTYTGRQIARMIDGDMCSDDGVATLQRAVDVMTQGNG